MIREALLSSAIAVLVGKNADAIRSEILYSEAPRAFLGLVENIGISDAPHEIAMSLASHQGMGFLSVRNVVDFVSNDSPGFDAKVAVVRSSRGDRFQNNGFCGYESAYGFLAPSNDDILSWCLPCISYRNAGLDVAEAGWRLVVGVTPLSGMNIHIGTQPAPAQVLSYGNAAGSMVSGGPRIDGGGNGSQKRQRTDSRSDPELQPSHMSAIRSRISSLPLGAKIGFSVIMTLIASGVGGLAVARYMKWEISNRAVVLRILSAIGILWIGLAVASA